MNNYKDITRNSYDQTASQYQANTDKLQPETKCEPFLSHLQQAAHILDLGCGPGRDSKYFAELGYNVTGIDFSPNMIEMAKALVPSATFLVADIENLTFNNDTFDAVWASASLLHVPKQKLPNVIQKIYACLKAQGIFYVSMKKGAGEDLKSDTRYGGVEKFWTFINENELKELLETSGFQILSQETHDISTTYQTNPWIAVICQKMTKALH